MMVRHFALFLSLTILTTLAAVFPRTSGADPSFYQGRIIDITPVEIPPGQTSAVRLRIRNTGVGAFFHGEITSLPGPWFVSPVKTEATFIDSGKTGSVIFNITPPEGAPPVDHTVRFRLTTLVNDSPFLEKFLDEQEFQIKPVMVPGPFTLIYPGELETGVTQPLTFQWNPATQAESYQLTVWTAVNGEPAEPSVTFEDIPGTTFTLPEDVKLAEGGGETYLWAVTAVNSQGQRPNTEGPVIFQMFREAPVQPFEMLVPAANDEPMPTTPTFEWTTSQNAILYWVQIHGEIDGIPQEPPLFSYIVDAPDTSFTVPDHLPPARYWLRIGAFNRSSIGLSNPEFRSFWVTSIGGFNLIEPAVETENVSPSPLFRWEMAENVLGYRLEIAHEYETGWVVLPTVELSPFDTSHEWRGEELLPGREYFWRVVAVTSASERQNNGGWRPFRVSPLNPFRTVAPYDDEQAVPLKPTFAWQRSIGAQNYQVQLAPDLSGAPNLGQMQTSPSLNAETFTWASTFPDLIPNSRYFFRVRATAGGAERFSAEGWTPFTTTLMTPFALVAPANNATNVSRTPFLQWEPVTGATGYRVHMTLVGTGNLPPVEIPTNTTSLSWDSASPLSPAAQYEWTVEAIHPAESRFASTPFRFRTQNRTSLPTRDDVIDALVGRGYLSPIDRLQLGIPTGRPLSVEDVIPYTN